MTDARSAMLQVIEESKERPGDYPGQRIFYRRDVLEKTAAKLGFTNAGYAPLAIHWAVLDAWHDLYRSGLITWGATLGQTIQHEEAAHLTEYGQQAIADLSRDPSHPGYLTTLRTFIPTTAIALAYAEEAVLVYNRGCDRAAAVLIGAASESLVLDLRDALVARMTALLRTPSAKLRSDKVKTVRDAMSEEIERASPTMPLELRERFSGHWQALTEELRRTRNDAGHPKSIAPVAHDLVHAALLIFPAVARLAKDLGAWIANGYS